MMELLNTLSSFRPEDEREKRLFREGVDVLLACLNPFCPHMTEVEPYRHRPLAKLPWPKAIRGP
ncbi:hypothetical protein MASR2M79_20540 [Aminivibrio sp.]